jgi:hypothetical protein
MSKYMAVIKEAGERRELEAVRSDYIGETRSMAERTAERLMIRGDITAGADITIILYGTGIRVEEYYWPQLPA